MWEAHNQRVKWSSSYQALKIDSEWRVIYDIILAFYEVPYTLCVLSPSSTAPPLQPSSARALHIIQLSHPSSADQPVGCWLLTEWLTKYSVWVAVCLTINLRAVNALNSWPAHTCLEYVYDDHNAMPSQSHIHTKWLSASAEWQNVRFLLTININWHSIKYFYLFLCEKQYKLFLRPVSCDAIITTFIFLYF